MPEARHYTAAAAHKGTYALPAEYDSRVNRAVLYQAVRAYRNNQRQGTASTKTRAEVSGGNRKPWRQKGTGRARQGTIRAPHWVGGGVVFGPRPRSYRTDLPRKVRRLATQSALNARAAEGAIHVLEALEFPEPKTRQMVQMLTTLGLGARKVLVLTAETAPNVFRSGRNLPTVHVMRYADVAAYDVLWADALVIEEAAIGGHHVAGSETSSARAKRAKRAASAAGKAKRTKASTRKKPSAKPAARTKASKPKAKRRPKGKGDA